MSRRPRTVRRRYPLSLHLRSALSRRRRLVAALLLGLAAALVVLRLGPPQTRTVPVVTAAGQLVEVRIQGAGDTLTANAPILLPQGPYEQYADALRSTFLPRHGADHSLPPHMINYRANAWAMKEVGVERIIGPPRVELMH